MCCQSKYDVVIVIPIYKDTKHLSKDELFSLTRTLKIFNKRHIVFACPESLYININAINSYHHNIKLKNFPDYYFRSIRHYNKLLYSPRFYSEFSQYEYILICQLDVVVLRDDLDFWLRAGYDFVGAPIFEGYLKPTDKIKKTGSNGGFSLRKVHSFIKVNEKTRYRYSSLSALLHSESRTLYKVLRVIRDGIIFNYKWWLLGPLLNEDIYWSIVVPYMNKWFVCCDPLSSIDFAFDNNPSKLLSINSNKLPMAIHGWRKYDVRFAQYIEDLLDHV